MQRIVPMVAYEDAASAITLLTEAFGFQENEAARQTAPDGTIGHAELELDGGKVFLATPSPDYQSPKHHRETCEASRRWLDNPWVVDGLFVQVDDIDAHCARARGAGATVLRGPETVEAVGIRLYTAEDLEGHRWMFAQSLAEGR